MQIISDYTYALDLLDDFDHQRLSISGTTNDEHYKLSVRDAYMVVMKLRDTFGGTSLMGKEKDQSFKSSVNAVYQTFAGKELYPSIEEKAAHLLYFVTKNHSFIDGNKRIAAALFIWYLAKNKILHRNDGTKRLADNALVALTLMIAESCPEDKDTLIKIIVYSINRNN